MTYSYYRIQIHQYCSIEGIEDISSSIKFIITMYGIGCRQCVCPIILYSVEGWRGGGCALNVIFYMQIF